MLEIKVTKFESDSYYARDKSCDFYCFSGLIFSASHSFVINGLFVIWVVAFYFFFLQNVEVLIRMR